MQFVTTQHAFRADDPSGIAFSLSDHASAPTAVRAVRCGHVSLVVPQLRTIQVADLTHVRSARCGTRPSVLATTRWSSNTIFSIYHHREPEFRTRVEGEVVIASVDGFGPRFFFVDQLAFAETFLPLVPTMPEVALWDLCNAIVGTADEAFKQGRAVEQHAMMEASAEGRVKRRKTGDAVSVKITPKPLVWRDTPTGREARVDLCAATVPGVNPVVPASSAAA